MKSIISLAFGITLAASYAYAAPEITATDIARHMGIHFWKFSKDDLPARFDVALLEIKDGRIIGTYLGAFSSPDSGDLVVGLESKGGKLEATMSIGSSVMGLGASVRKEIGSTARLNHTKILVGVPIVLAGDYRPSEGETVITGKVEDVISGVALLLESRN